MDTSTLSTPAALAALENWNVANGSPFVGPLAIRRDLVDFASAIAEEASDAEDFGFAFSDALRSGGGEDELFPSLDEERAASLATLLESLLEGKTEAPASKPAPDPRTNELVRFRRFDASDWRTFSGAASFPDGSNPFIAELRVLLSEGREVDGFAILDGEGFAIEAVSEDGEDVARFSFRENSAGTAIALATLRALVRASDLLKIPDVYAELDGEAVSERA